MNIISDQKVFFLVILKQKIVNQNIKCHLILPWQFHQNPREANITFFFPRMLLLLDNFIMDC